MKIYTIIKYRDSKMDRTYDEYSHSDFGLYITSDMSDAIDKAIEWMVAGDKLTDDRLSSDSRDYYNTEVSVLINGYGDGFDHSLDDPIPDEWVDECNYIIQEAASRAQSSIEAQVADKQQEEESRRRKVKEKTERDELILLAKLKEKYEGSVE